MADAIDQAILSISQANSREELKKIYKELTALHGSQKFIDALNDRQQELKDAAV